MISAFWNSNNDSFDFPRDCDRIQAGFHNRDARDCAGFTDIERVFVKVDAVGAIETLNDHASAIRETVAVLVCENVRDLAEPSL